MKGKSNIFLHYRCSYFQVFTNCSEAFDIRISEISNTDDIIVVSVLGTVGAHRDCKMVLDKIKGNSKTPQDMGKRTDKRQSNLYTVADLHSKILDARTPPPRRSKFFQFHAVFGKIWQNRMLAPPLRSWRPLLGEILDPALIHMQKMPLW